ncbi:hypothetical protein B0H16DRAFT_1633972, partial [Mycena metata]
MAAPDAANVRIITTLGHVDHGKTTLMDALLAANNIISSRMAGKMRYMDSREDEQERGITMESSAVSLRFQVMDKDAKPKVYVVNMIDTPGHVISRVRCLPRPGYVDGVCTQTIAVLRQAWLDRLRPILVINKFDRLITELQLAPVEAYTISRDDLRWREERERRMAEKKEMHADEADAAVDEEFQEKDDEDIYLSPERGNVIPPRDLKSKDTRHPALPHFLAMALPLDVHNPDSRSHTENALSRLVRRRGRFVRLEIRVGRMRRRLCQQNVLGLREGPPREQEETHDCRRMRARARGAKEAREAAAAAAEKEEAAEKEGTLAPESDTPSTGAVTEEPPVEEAGDVEVILGFARLYSGTITTGVSVYGILPKYNASLGPTHPRNTKHIVSIVVEGLYVMMGRELVAVDSVRAGNIFAIKGLEGKVWRSATLCAPGAIGIGESPDLNALKDCLVNLGGVNRTAPPILRVALEPAKPADMQKLISGLKLLSQSDPCVETFQQQTGEYVILTAGELHFERCLKDLRERFARVEIQASKPIVPFRETAVKGIDMAPPKTANAPRGTIHGNSSQNIVTFTIRASPLPRPILEFILQNVVVLKILQGGDADADAAEMDEEDGSNIDGNIVRKPSVKPEEFWDALRGKCQEAGGSGRTLPSAYGRLGRRTPG